jgi:mutual gliding-motility protein MglA
LLPSRAAAYNPRDPMVLFNYSTKELTAKVVYYGPGLCGKTTNLQWIHEKLPIKNKGKMVSLATEADRTLFFDFLPIELGTIRGMKTRIQLYTVPGQVFYNATRRMVLKGADCVVFVADSQEAMIDANLDALQNLRENLEANEIDPDEISTVIQYNKRDLPNAAPVDVLQKRLNPKGWLHFEACAKQGIGVEETLKGVTGLVFRSLATKYGGAEAARAAAKPAPPPRPAPPPPAPRVAPAPAAQENLLDSLVPAAPAAQPFEELSLSLEEAPGPATAPSRALVDELALGESSTAPDIEALDTSAASEMAGAEDLDLEELAPEPAPAPPPLTLDALDMEPLSDPAAPGPLELEALGNAPPPRATRPTAPPDVFAPEPPRTGQRTSQGATAAVPVRLSVPASGGNAEVTLPIEISLGAGAPLQLRITIQLKK